MPTTVPSSIAIELPRIVAVSTQRPRAVERCRPSAPMMALLREAVAWSVTPADIAEKTGRLRMAAVCGVAPSAVRYGRVHPVAGHDQSLFGQRQQTRRDARDDGLQVAAGRGLARPAVEKRVAGDDGAPDAERDAPRSVSRGVQHGDAHRADRDLRAVVEAAVDALLGDLHLRGADEH